MRINRKPHYRHLSAYVECNVVIAALLALSLTISVACQTKRRPSEPQWLIFEFETVTMNGDKKITSRRKGQARYFVENINGVALEMVDITGGKFLMGTSPAQVAQERALSERIHDRTIACEFESPQHEVDVPSFYISKYEVTQAQWKAVAKLRKVNLNLDPDPSHYAGDDLPVEQITWDEAMEFCARLSRATGRAYRLPTEAEWEYACRAGTTTAFAFGENIAEELASRAGKSPVGATKVANGFGLYDMHGSVMEWCLDYWHDDYNGAPTDGSARQTGRKPVERVIRGGFYADRDRGRSASRSPVEPERRGSSIGFRVVAVPQTR